MEVKLFKMRVCRILHPNEMTFQGIITIAILYDNKNKLHIHTYMTPYFSNFAAECN